MESLSTTTRVSNRQRPTVDFHHRICKLRWIGNDDEAESLLRTRSRKDESTVTWPVEMATD